MVDLSVLTLLRNDPEVADEMLAAAEKGDVNAQYGMGLIYAEGRGVDQDEAKSFYWLRRAMEQGDEDAKTLQHVIAAIMTAEQFEQASQLWDAYHAVPSPAVRVRRRRQRTSASKSGMH